MTTDDSSGPIAADAAAWARSLVLARIRDDGQEDMEFYKMIWGQMALNGPAITLAEGDDPADFEKRVAWLKSLIASLTVLGALCFLGWSQVEEHPDGDKDAAAELLERMGQLGMTF